jgi:hypothetical protein
MNPWHSSPPPGTTFVLLGHHPPPPPPVLPSSEDDSCRIEQRELSCLSYILASWQRHILTLPEDTFPTFEQVADRNFVTDTHHVTYAHAGAEWHSSHRIKRLNDQRILIVHLANDGYLYFNPDDLTVDKVANRRHPTCNAGWKVLKTGEATLLPGIRICLVWDYRDSHVRPLQLKKLPR